jgi:hypothetical protein
MTYAECCAINPDLLAVDGYEECVKGVVDRSDQTFLVYDTECVHRMLEDMDMDPNEAKEFFDFNIAGAWMGENTPGFLTPFEPPDDTETD